MDLMGSKLAVVLSFIVGERLKIKISSMFAIYCLFSVISISVDAASDELLPVDTYFDRIDEFNHVMSPDGNHLAFIRDTPTTYQLSITDLNKFDVIHETAISGKYPQELKWLSNRVLMFRIDGKIYAINRDGTDIRVLIDHIYGDKEIKYISQLRKNIKWWSLEDILRDDDEHILVRSTSVDLYESIHKINIFSGEKIDLYDGDKYKVNKWIVGSKGETALAIKYKKDRSTFYHFDEDDQKLIKMIDKNNRFIFDNSGKNHLKKRAKFVAVTSNENKIYLTENVTGDRFSLSYYDYEKDKIKLIYDDPKYDIGDSDSAPRLIVDPESKKLIGIRYTRDREETVWLDERYKKVQDEIDKIYPGKINSIIQWGSDFERILFRSYDEKSFGRKIIYIPEKGQRIVQMAHHSLALQEKMAETKVISYKTSDGKEIEAYLTLPTVAKKMKGAAKKMPLIVMPHGGPFDRSVLGYDPYTQYFASRGYAVIEPNFRGSTGYGYKHLSSGRGAIHNLMLEDIADSARWAISEELVDKDSVYIFGFSYGGYAAIMSALKYPDLYSSAFSYGAPLNIKKQMKWYKKNDFHFAYEYWDEMVLGSSSSAAFVKDISPYYQLERATIPIHIYHGEKDETIPVEHAKDLKKKLKKNGSNKNVIVTLIKSEGHTMRIKSNEIYLAEKIHKAFSTAGKSN